MLCTIVDISARRQVEKHLRQTQKLEAIGTLAGGIAHDFNNVLQGIMGYAELLRDAVRDRPEAVADAEVILATAQRGRDLVNRILQFSRKDEPARGRVALEPLIAETVRLLRATLRHSVEIRTYIDSKTPDVSMDPTELHQILMNLANNASQAMEDKGGLIDIKVGPVLLNAGALPPDTALRPGVYARVSVSDTGPGIPAAILQRIFEPFFTTKPIGKGTGLGLAMVQRIVRGLGGNVVVDSVVGRGTRFDIYLPAIPGAESRVYEETPVHADRGRILYVDDEEQLAEMGKRLLLAAGFEVDAYCSSLQALADFRAAPERYDLVVTDNNMPHLPGIELAAAVTKMRPDLPVLMVSGNGEGYDRTTLAKHGVRQLIQKPYSLSDLKAAVLELIRQSRAPGDGSSA